MGEACDSNEVSTRLGEIAEEWEVILRKLDKEIPQVVWPFLFVRSAGWDWLRQAKCLIYLGRDADTQLSHSYIR